MANNHEFTSAYSYSIRYAQWKYRWWSSTTDVWRIKYPFQSIDLQLIFLLRVFRVNYLLFVYLTQRVQKRIREKCVSGREKETIERMYVRVYCFYDSLLLLLFFCLRYLCTNDSDDEENKPDFEVISCSIWYNYSFSPLRSWRNLEQLGMVRDNDCLHVDLEITDECSLSRTASLAFFSLVLINSCCCGRETWFHKTHS